MADNRIAYGLAKKYGIDTKDMSPKEVWEALKNKGITEENISDGAYNSQESKAKELVKKVTEKKEEKARAEIKLRKTTPKVFIENMVKAKNSIPEERRWRVDIHNGEDYDKDKLFTTKGGSCVAIEPDGNIISVCRNNGDITARGTDLVRHAVDNGGDRLDAYSYLYGFYVRQGFEPVSWTPFNEEYAPDGWDENRDKPEKIIFYKYTGKNTDLTLNEFVKKVRPSEDYDKAKKIRDMEIRK